MKDILIKQVKLSDIDPNDPIFDTLKNDYYNFNKWFEKKQKLGYYAYITKNKNKLGAFLLLKIENKKEKYFKYNCKRLKICTFKVKDKNKGIGTKFMNIINNEAIKNKVDEVYVTTYIENKEIINYFKKNNFYIDTYKTSYKKNKIKGKEVILVHKISSNNIEK